MPARILVIEDNPTNLDLMAYLLNAMGYSVIPATTMRDGLRHALGDDPDLILCDIQLPDGNGFDIARELKGRCGVPLVAVTAYAMVGDRERILAAGFDAYLSKPIEPEAFLSEMASLLSRNRGESGRAGTLAQ